MKIRELYKKNIESYHNNKRRKGFDKELFFVRYIYRPLSFPLTVPFLFLGISANQATILNGFLAFISFILINLTPKYLEVMGVLSYFLFFVMDFIDGNIARFHNWTSFMGKIIDGFVDTLGYLVFLAVGFKVYLTQSGLFVNSKWYLLLGLVTTLFEVFLQYWRLRLTHFLFKIDVYTDNLKRDSSVSKASQSRTLVQWVNVIRKNLLNGVGVTLAVFYFFDGLSYFVIFYAMLTIPFGAAEIVLSAYRNRKILLETTTRISY